MLDKELDLDNLKLTDKQWDKIYELFDSLNISKQDINNDRTGNLKQLYLKRIEEVLGSETQ